MSFDLSNLLCDSGIAALEYRPRVGSTNDWAIELAAEDGRELPLLVLTEEQTGGRGRGVNRWWSAAGGLTFSLVLDAAKLESRRWPLVALATGVAVCESLQSVFREGTFALKWPNDVYLNGKKACGILVESPSHARQRIVIGVGINVNNSFAAAPHELRERATALCDEAGGDFDLTSVLSSVVRAILARFTEICEDADSIVRDFRGPCLLTGKIVQIESGRETIHGRCAGIDDEGMLLVQSPASLHRVASGTVLSWE